MMFLLWILSSCRLLSFSTNSIKSLFLNSLKQSLSLNSLNVGSLHSSKPWFLSNLSILSKFSKDSIYVGEGSPSFSISNLYSIVSLSALIVSNPQTPISRRRSFVTPPSVLPIRVMVSLYPFRPGMIKDGYQLVPGSWFKPDRFTPFCKVITFFGDIS